jgi:simple sugar transport system permease protein
MLSPELTAVAGTIVVFAFFAFNAGGNGFLTFAGTRNYLEVAGEIGIIAVPVTLLLIAGEFDLSVGVMIGATGVAVAYTATVFGWPLWACLLVGLTVAGAVGLINGLVVVRMGIPSFLVTLASMFMVKGVTLAVTMLLIETTQIFRVKTALKGDFLLPLFGGTIWGLDISIVWWIGLTLLAAYVLSNTRFGNWIYASGGDREAALKMGVPVGVVKVSLYVATSMSATLVAVLSMMLVDQAEATQGGGKEFEAVTAAVIGGAAITGGFGSPIGSFFGALMFGMVSQGFFYTDIDDNWFYGFVGAILLVAVAINKYVRQAAARPTRRS